MVSFDLIRCLTSPLFTFQVGPDKMEITVHSFTFAELSKPLNALVNGEIIEAKTRRVDWSDVDLVTLTRLCEYAIAGDYTRFDVEEQQAKLLEKFFSPDEIEAAKEEKDESLTRLR